MFIEQKDQLVYESVVLKKKRRCQFIQCLGNHSKESEFYSEIIKKMMRGSKVHDAVYILKPSFHRWCGGTLVGSEFVSWDS